MPNGQRGSRFPQMPEDDAHLMGREDPLGRLVAIRQQFPGKGLAILDPPAQAVAGLVGRQTREVESREGGFF